MTETSVKISDGDDLALGVPGHSASAASLSGKLRRDAARAVQHAFHVKPPVSTMVWLANVATVAAATLGVAYASPQPTIGHPHIVGVAGLVGFLTFCLLSQNYRALNGQPAGTLTGQTLQLAPVLLCAAAASAAVFELLGWDWHDLFPAVLLWFAVSALSLTVTRSAATYALTHPSVTARMARKVAVIGNDGHALRISSLCNRQTRDPIHFLGIFSDEPARSRQVQVQGSIDDLIALSRDSLLDDIIIAIPPDDAAAERVSQLRWRLRGVAVEIYIMPYLAQGEDVVLPVEMFGPFSLMVVQRRPLSHAQVVRKRMLDLVLGALLLILLFPVFLAVALIVKLDSPGPVLFRQPRLGLNDRPFTVLKFRSMYVDAADLMAARQTTRKDPRVTRAGKWLRRLSLDELPQLFNVLAGDMSLVGPRPHAPHTRAGGQLLKDAMAEYVIRHQVKPGITGWAQVNGSRGEIVTMEDLRRRVNYDLEYIRRWSAAFDLKIIFMTVSREVFSKHAF